MSFYKGNENPTDLNSGVEIIMDKFVYIFNV